jgi:protein N-terminal amidase
MSRCNLTSLGIVQFTPELGRVEENRKKALQMIQRLQDPVDIVILPEMCFTGYNLSRETVCALAEEEDGETVQWARKLIASGLCKYVMLGFPLRRPNQDEFFNCVVIVSSSNPIGKALIYKKHFLYEVDESWAKEGPGFTSFNLNLDGLHLKTCPGICMDINPKGFKAPFTAYEFARHCQSEQARLILLSNAWRLGPDAIVQDPLEPHHATIRYWIQRLAPLVLESHDSPILVVVCNRTGVEHNVTFAGSSCAFLFHGGKYRVLASLGVAEESLLLFETTPSRDALLSAQTR